LKAWKIAGRVFGNPIPDKATKLLEAGKFKIECLQKSKQTKFGKGKRKVKVKNIRI